MKFRCEREVLAEALGAAGRATTGRSGSLPVLAGIRLELKGSKLSVTGSNIELTVQQELEVNGQGDGGNLCFVAHFSQKERDHRGTKHTQ